MYSQEFLDIYKKNLNLIPDSESNSIESYLKLYVDFKLKVKEAKDLGLDTVSKFKNELNQYKNNLVLIIISITTIITGLLLYVEPLTNFFEFQYLSIYQLSISIAIGFLSVIWYEFVKLYNREYNKIFEIM